MPERRAKIVCTIGPASSQRLGELIEAGMDVARLNFSHGAHSEHAEVVADIRRLSKEMNHPVAILQDLQGPKIRTGRYTDGPLTLQTGQIFFITTDEIIGDVERVSTTYKSLPEDVDEGDEILLSDGLLRLVVRRIQGAEVECEVVDGGVLRERAGINLPGADLSVPSMTEKDREDLEFGIAQKVDYVALSFVRRADDIAELKALLRRADVPIGAVAKLEKPQAIQDLDAIIEATDVVMVARGDLGVELSPERVPAVQKRIIRAAVRAGKPVITATQMLESMIEHPRPTRAEASDVANAIFDGTDAVMLSGETAVGKYPVAVVQMMDRIVREAESELEFTPDHRRRRRAEELPLDFPDAIADAAGRVAVDIQAAAIVAFTQTGFTAQLISKYRPTHPVFAFTSHDRVLCRLCLHWGIYPRRIDFVADTDQMITKIDKMLCAEGHVQAGDNLVILAGMPPTQQGTTNLLRLHQVEKALS
jgi:pyruvate kinase